MRKQRNMSQTKQEKTPENKLNEMEASHIPETEFRITVIRMQNEFMWRMDEHNQNLNREIVSIKKDIETIKRNQTEMRNTTTEMKNTLEGFNSRLDEAEDRVSELEDKVAEYTQ